MHCFRDGARLSDAGDIRMAHERRERAPVAAVRALKTD
jgi:hypothetical protein